MVDTERDYACQQHHKRESTGQKSDSESSSKDAPTENSKTGTTQSLRSWVDETKENHNGRIHRSVQHQVVMSWVRVRLQEQELRVSSGELPWNMQTRSVSGLDKLAVLLEEVGEVGSAMQRRHVGTDKGNLFEELIDVAACAIGWLESLEKS